MTDTRPVAVQVGGGLGNQLFGLTAGLWASYSLRCGLEVDVSAARPENLARGEVGQFAERDVELDSFTLPLSGKGVPVRIVERPFRPPLRGEMRLRRALSRMRVPSGEYWPTPWRVDDRILQVARSRRLRGNFHTWGYWRRYRALGGTLNLSPLHPTQWFKDSLSVAQDYEPVGLHVRLGDYTRVLPHLVSTRAFISSALRVVKAHIGYREIWLFSDDIESAHELIDGLHSSATVRVLAPPKESRAVESLFLLSNMKAVVCSASSFSIWAAQLSHPGTIVVLPDTAGQSFGTDGFRENWTTLPAGGI